jgi:hypothetical protein
MCRERATHREERTEDRQRSERGHGCAQVPRNNRDSPLPVSSARGGQAPTHAEQGGIIPWVAPSSHEVRQQFAPTMAITDQSSASTGVERGPSLCRKARSCFTSSRCRPVVGAPARKAFVYSSHQNRLRSNDTCRWYITARKMTCCRRAR